MNFFQIKKGQLLFLNQVMTKVHLIKSKHQQIYLFNFFIHMNIKEQFSAIVQPHPFVITQYRTPQEYLDPNKIIQQRKNMKYKHRSQGKFKPSPRKKQFFIDEVIKPFKINPAPSKYTTGQDLLSKKNKKNPNNVIKPNIRKNTYIDQIQLAQEKQKAPGIGKYNLLTMTDFPQNSPIRLKQRQNPQKRSYFDSLVTQTLQKPGPGEHNPHTIEKKVKPDRTTYKFYQEKHQKEKQKIKRSLSAKLGPTTYNPVCFNTFDSIKIKSKNPEPSKWTHGQIEIRKGFKSEEKHPSPAEYQLINQWSPGKSLTSRNNSASEIGKIKLFQKTIKSARSLNVYRD